MEEFAAGTDVFVTFPHSNNTTTLTVTDLKYQVLDAQGVILKDWSTAPSFNPAATSTTITVLKELNATTDKLDVRQVNVQLYTSSGTYQQTSYYKLVGDLTKLTVMKDSFMSYPESIVARAKMSETMEYFDALPDSLKAVALENAFRNIVKLKFRFTTTQQCGTDIRAYSVEQFKTLPAEFQEAVKKAQLSEANSLVENSPIQDKIRQGIISETIGESSMFFKQSGPTSSRYPGLSDDAYPHITEYLFKSATNAQIWKLARA